MHLTAHSGSSGTRMNSKEYLEKALYEPVDFIEIDVRKNHDGALILSHNPDGDGVPVVSLKDAFCILHHSVKNINCDCKQYQLGPEILYMAEKADIESERIFFSGSMKPDFSEEEAITFDVSAKQIFINAEELLPDFYSMTDPNRFERLAALFLQTECRALNIDYQALMEADALDAMIHASIPLSFWTIDDPVIADHFKKAIPEYLLENITTRYPERMQFLFPHS